MSLGGDADRPLAESRVNQLAEEAVAPRHGARRRRRQFGLRTARHRVLPPATAPSVIAVGGYDDGNDPERRNLAAVLLELRRDGRRPRQARADRSRRCGSRRRSCRARRPSARAGAGAAGRDAGQPAGAARGRSVRGDDPGLPRRWRVRTLRSWIDEQLRAEKIVGGALSARGRDLVRGAGRRLGRRADARGQSGAHAGGQSSGSCSQTASPVPGIAGDPPGVRRPRRRARRSRRRAREAHAGAGGPGGPPRRERPARVHVPRRRRDVGRGRRRLQRLGPGRPSDGAASRGGVWRAELAVPPPGPLPLQVRGGRRPLAFGSVNARREPDPYGGSDSILQIP